MLSRGRSVMAPGRAGFTLRDRSARRLRQAGVVVGMIAALACFHGNTTEPTSLTTVTEAGWSFGFCLGPCQGTLMVDGEAVRYTISSREGEVFADNEGTLTSTGAGRLATAVAGLPGRLAARYGCPDCADGGAAFFELQGEAGPRRVEYEYRGAPAALVALDSELNGIMEALAACRPTNAVTPAAGCIVFER